MASGQKAADQTKDAFKQVNDASEGLRKNINSFADDLIGGNRSHGGTSFHPDAKKAGKDVEKGVDSAGKKLDQMVDKHKK